MNVPDEPPNTCPLIDAVIEQIQLVPASTAWMGMVRGIMETIRDHNDTLRKRAQFFEQEYGVKDEELDKVRDELEEANDRAKELEARSDE